ncbi:MAG: hypothetical protein GF364_10115 [Candidatus Lokiarchaeota archaeon]|nr:hypothetical protein [Candidatus Lokiarchaeota archaeon]
MLKEISDIILISLFVILVICSCQILLRTRQISTDLRYYYYGIAFYFIMFVVSQSLFLINEYLFVEEESTYELIYILGNFLGNVGIAILMFVVERKVYNKLRYIPTIIIAVATVLMLILYQIMIVFIIIDLVAATLIPIIYIRVAFQTTGDTRVKGILHGIGLIVFMIGILLNTYFIGPIYIVAPLLELSGVLIFQYALLFYGQGTE